MKRKDSSYHGGLMALVSHKDTNEDNYSKNVEDSIYSNKRRKVTKNNFSYNYQSFEKLDKYTYNLILERKCDIIGKTYLEFNYSKFKNINKIIKDIEFVIGGQSIEKLSGDMLYILNKDKELYHDNKYIIPLNFFYTESPDIYLKLISTSLNFIDIKFNINFIKKVNDVNLIYQGIYVDSIERKNIAITPHKDTIIIKNSNQINIFDTKTNQIRKVLRSLSLKGFVKDIILYVKTKNNIDEPIKNIKIKLNSYTIIDVDNVMSRYTIPQELYNTKNNELIYYLPFDLDTSNFSTISNVNMSNIDHIMLELDILDGDYEIMIMNKQVNFANYEFGNFKINSS